MTKPNPLAEQCTATSKATGQRCRIRVVGGGPCRLHGGAAPQVRAAREVRILTAEAAREAPKSSADSVDVLTSAMNDAHSLLQRLKVNIAGGQLTAADLTALGDWVDRAARISKLVVDAGIEERRVQIAAADGRILAGVIQRSFAGVLARVLAALVEHAESRDLVVGAWGPAIGEVVPHELHAVVRGETDRDHE